MVTVATDTAEDASEYPLWNISYKMQFLSPLYATEPLTNGSLATHASAFHNQLAGNALRGVEVGPMPAHDLALGVGSLVRVKWTVLPEAEAWNLTATQDGEHQTLVANQNKGILILITYEGAQYRAILLRSTRGSGTAMHPSLEHYPVLLTQMPDRIQQRLVQYLNSTFDTLAYSHMGSSALMARLLENYIHDIFVCDPDADAGYAAVMMLVKSMSLTYGFYEIHDCSLLTFDIGIPSTAISEFLRKAHQHFSADVQRGPFFTFLSAYVRKHLAMELTNPDIFLSKIVCSGFEMSMTKLKIYQPINDDQAKATEELLDSLLHYVSKKVQTMPEVLPTPQL